MSFIKSTRVRVKLFNFSLVNKHFVSLLKARARHDLKKLLMNQTAQPIKEEKVILLLLTKAR